MRLRRWWPDKSSQAAGQVFEPDRAHKSLHVLGRCPETMTLVTGLKPARESDMPSKPVWGRELPGGFDSRPPPRGEIGERAWSPADSTSPPHMSPVLKFDQVRRRRAVVEFGSSTSPRDLTTSPHPWRGRLLPLAAVLALTSADAEPTRKLPIGWEAIAAARTMGARCCRSG